MTKYSLIRSIIFVEDIGQMTTYGLQTTNLLDNISIKDISTNIEKVKNFIKICNDYNVSPTTLNDVIEDYIS